MRIEQIPAIMKVIGREIKLDNKNNPKGQQQNDFILKSDTLKDLIKILILYSSIVFTDSDSEEKEKVTVFIPSIRPLYVLTCI